MKRIGYMVIESALDYEQILGIDTDKKYPAGGILTWKNSGRAVFPSRADARKAISRTEHYRLAFGLTDLPEKKDCTVVAVVAAS